MKNRNKVILSSAAMLAIAGASLGTGAVAWFTGTRVGTSTTSNVNVQARDANLTIVAQEGATSASTDDNRASAEGIEAIDVNIKLDGANVAAQSDKTLYATDITGYETLIKPNWSAVDSDRTAADSFSAASANGDYIDFKLKFTQVNASAADYSLFLGSTSTVTNTGDGTASKAVRVAILDESLAAGSKVKCYWKPYAASDSDKSYIESASGETALGVTGYKSKDVTWSGANVSGTFGNYTVNSSGAKVAPDEGTASPVLASIPSGDTGTTLTVRIWLEGTDVDCVDSIKANIFTTALQFYILPSALFA